MTSGGDLAGAQRARPGFFMILVDSTIVSVATPAIIEDFRSGREHRRVGHLRLSLAYAVPMLITGRLGDRVGPKRMYLAGLVVFTLSSLWCGLTGTIEGLVIARVVQGLGASMMSPQTMAIITRIFPLRAAERPWPSGARRPGWRPSSVRSSAASSSMPGWPWVFFVNVPVGIIAFVLASRLVPRVDTHAHAFDWLGVALSAVGMFLLVFGIQGPPARLECRDLIDDRGRAFVLAPLHRLAGAKPARAAGAPRALPRPPTLAVANLAISTMGFAITAMAIPLMIWAQVVRGLSPTRAALLMAPMALASLLRPDRGSAHRSGPPAAADGPRLHRHDHLARVDGLDHLADDRPVVDGGPMLLLGIGNSFVWGPKSASATRNLPPRRAGAGSGVYNTTRQVGAVLGSAAIAVLMDSRLAAQGLGAMSGSMQSGSGHQLPAAVAEKLSIVMAESLYLPPAACSPRHRPAGRAVLRASRACRTQMR